MAHLQNVRINKAARGRSTKFKIHFEKQSLSIQRITLAPNNWEQTVYNKIELFSRSTTFIAFFR